MKTVSRFSLPFFFITLFFLHASQPAYAKVVINEFSSGGSSDWVELYNDSETEVPLSEYQLRDSSSTNKLDLNGILSGKGFIVFEWADRLNNNGDVIRLVNADDISQVEDSVTYGNLEGSVVDAPSSSQYAARTTDAAASWALYTSATKGATNTNANPVPTATPTPTETPKPSPTPTKVPTPTKTPTPTDAPSVTTSISSQTLGAASKLPTPTTDYHMPTPILAQHTDTPWPTIAPTKPPVSVRTLAASTRSPSFLLLSVGSLFLIGCFSYGYYLYRKGQL